MNTLKTASSLSGVALIALISSAAVADENHAASAVFGGGLNTSVPPGQPVNHVVVPTDIRIKAGGVVDFTVAGFHDIVIFNPGFTLQDLIDVGGGGGVPMTPPVYVIPPDPATPLPLALAALEGKIYYRGINPAGGPSATPATANPSNSVNRGEVVFFRDKGTYLVICNVRPHLLDGMIAYVRVN
jgi:plastocyanin